MSTCCLKGPCIPGSFEGSFRGSIMVRTITVSDISVHVPQNQRYMSRLTSTKINADARRRFSGVQNTFVFGAFVWCQMTYTNLPSPDRSLKHGFTVWGFQNP